MPLYGVVGATFLLGGYTLFWNTAKDPSVTANTSDKKQELPGSNQKQDAKGRCHTMLVSSA